MTTMTAPAGSVTGGVDTHLDQHVAAAVDHLGGVLGTASFATNKTGYRKLLAWLRSHEPLHKVGVEGTGSYGSALARHLAAEAVQVVELPGRTGRPDAATARATSSTRSRPPRAALSGEAAGAPKAHDEAVEALRTLKVVQRSANKARTQTVNQLRNLIVTAPDELRGRLRTLPTRELLITCAAFRIAADDDTLPAITRLALRELARRVLLLDEQLRQVRRRLQRITAATAPDLLALHGAGPDTASTLLLTAGDNPDRLEHEKSFASLTGSSPLDASSGKRQRHRLNRGGDRKPTPLFGALPWSGSPPTNAPATTSDGAWPKAKQSPKRSAASSATSPAKSSTRYQGKPSFDSRSIT